MNRPSLFVALLGLVASCNAQVRGGIADVAIIDRESGAALTPYYYRGEYWVAGRPGARYAIEIRNRLDERLLAVTSVDGVNVISGATAAWDQTGYVFSPSERYQITGWRKSDAEIAAFTFTDSANSYAERTGRPANVGVIGVAIFRERPPPPAYVAPPIGQWPGRPEDPRASDSFTELPSGSMPRGAPAPTASDSAATADARMSSSATNAITAPMVRAPQPAPKLGTGHGEREYSYVNHTDFSRMQTQPNEVIRIHYDSLENLLAMGIVRRPHPQPSVPNPFPASPDQQYVPDPRG